MRRLISLSLLTVAACSAFGCRAINTPDAVVAPSITTASPTPERWLESATLVCLPASPVAATPAAEGNVEQATFSPAAPAAPAAAPPGPCTVRVLAIRYPHPDGRRDVARAELIVADPAGETSADNSLRPRLGRALSGILPGVAWGPGIRRAAGLNIPVEELQYVVAAAQQPPAGDGGATPTTALVRLDINGQPATIAAPSSPQLEQLAERVSREGRLISYRGSASELLAAAGR